MGEVKPLTLYGHASGPNPWKVTMVLEELEIPYEKIFVSFPKEVKSEPYTLLNPNGRVPTIVDPNTGITLWESGAIIEYLIDTYDKDHKISFSTFPEKYHLKQYLYFQASGQGPYFGQAAWFRMFHPEDVPSAKERYDEQAVRVLSVLDKILEGKKYLQGDKCTAADISFVAWNQSISMLLKDVWQKFGIDEKYPNYVAWHARVTARPVVEKVLKDWQAAMATGH